MNENKKVVVLGAGISGLATAHWLNKENFDVVVLEKSKTTGGAMITKFEDGYLIDYGPNSGLETTPLIRQIVDDVGLSDEMVYANEIANKRYILRNNELHALPTSPQAFLKTKLFSTKAKLRLMKEPFVGRSKDGYYQSIAEFVERRLGKEFLEYAIDPFVSGVFAGNPHKLSVKSAFPKLYRLEEIYGGLIKGMIRGAKERKKRNEDSKQNARMFSFVNGMHSFPMAIARSMDGKVKLNCNVQSVTKVDSKFEIKFLQNDDLQTLTADAVVSTVPAHSTSSLFELNGLKEHLDNIYYPPVLLLYLGFESSAIKRKLDGFGFLIPSKEEKPYLGAIWSSTIFNNRAPEGCESFTIFVGGARNAEMLSNENDEVIRKVIDEFKTTMKIDKDPAFVKSKLWHKAIPQYNLGYIEHESYFDKVEYENPGLFLSGNYRGGISVGDCVKNSEKVFNKVKDFFK